MLVSQIKYKRFCNMEITLKYFECEAYKYNIGMLMKYLGNI